jgi:hypothetical protein
MLDQLPDPSHSSLWLRKEIARAIARPVAVEEK